ncbi:alpha/beta fold hydrolase [Rhodococcus hoagii]|nr:alpha/beta fold hydrolase [Prescottella equi]
MTDPATTLTHRTVRVGDLDMHIAEQGEGDPIVLCHGFPGLWYSWRHQLSALSAAGYRVIAPDMRGYGRTDVPSDPREYDRRHTVDDMVGLLDALGIEQAVFSGHDFGAQLVWDLPNWAPGRVRALMQLSVPRMPRSPVRPTDGFRYMSSQHFVHLHYFQEYGPADRELGDHPREFLSKIFHALSGANRYLDCWTSRPRATATSTCCPNLRRCRGRGSARTNSATTWTSSRAPFTGGLNWYRADDYVWEQNEELHGRPVTVPTTFIAGAKDPVLEMMGRIRSRRWPRWSRPALDHVIPDVGHFVQMEAADQVNTAMLEFLRGLD